MSDLFDTLQERYQALVARKEKGETGEEFMEDVSSFIADAQRAGAVTADLDERSQLRAWMRFLANTLYDATGTYPDTSLQPLTRGQLVGPWPERLPGSGRRQKPSPAERLQQWALTAVAVGIIVVGSLWVMGRVMGMGPLAPTPTPTATPIVIVMTPTPTSVEIPSAVVGFHTVQRGETLFSIAAQYGADPLRIAEHNGIIDPNILYTGQMLSIPLPNPLLAADESLANPGTIFCAGTTEIYASFTLGDIGPEAEWGWEVIREEAVIAEQAMGPWREESQPIIVPILLEDAEGIPAGLYTLNVIVSGQTALSSGFEVLGTTPQVSNAQVSDVPSGVGYTEFTSGIRVLYVTYDYEGLCAGLSVTRAIYFDGERVHESSEAWSGTSDGSGQLEYYQPGRLPLTSGEYEVALGVGEEEPQRVNFTIVGPTPLTFGKIIIALGVQPDGTPILTAPDNTFDWRIKSVYAIFDYVGMSDGAEWQAVWTRNGQELPRPEDFQDVGMDGMDGKHWVVYYDESRSVLPGGSYSVTLYIDDDPQSTADFQILYYEPPE